MTPAGMSLLAIWLLFPTPKDRAAAYRLAQLSLSCWVLLFTFHGSAATVVPWHWSCSRLGQISKCKGLRFTSVPCLQRGEESGNATSTTNELKTLELRAIELEQEIEAAKQELEAAEEANAKVVTRVASLLTTQTKQDTRRTHSQYHVALSQQEADAQPQITRDGYESALLQTARLEAQLAMMKDQLQQLLQRKAEQEDLHAAKVVECRRAFG